MDLQIAGKVALITGSSRGIGRAIAKALWAEGCSVAINARTEKSLRTLESELKSRVSIHPADVTNVDFCRRIVDGVIARWGRLDIIVCNVGSGASVPSGQETPEEWRRVFAENFYATTNVIEAARTNLGKGAAIVCISSICGTESMGAPLTYSAAKAALNSYVRGLSRSLGPADIRINAVAPGNVLVEGGRWEERLNQAPDETKGMLVREGSIGALRPSGRGRECC